MYRSRWRQRSFAFSRLTAFIAAALIATTAMADTPPSVIEEGNGWQLMLVVPDAGTEGVSALTAGEPAPIVIIESAAGLSEAPLPDSIKDELASEFDGNGEPVSLAVHYEVAEAIANGTAEERYAEFLVPDDGVEGQVGTSGLLCSTGWQHRKSNFERAFEGFHYEKNLTSGGFVGDMVVDAPITGSGELEVEVAFKKTRFCLPWSFKFVQAHARATLNVGETMFEASGSAKYTTSDRKVLVTPGYTQSFMVGPVPVVVGVEFPIGAGYDIAAQATADIELRSRAQGQMSLDIICKRDGCARNEAGDNTNTITFEDLVNPTLVGGVNLQVDVKPYAFVEARGFLYDTTIGSAGVGVEVSAPSRLFFHAGNDCGSGTGAATGDMVAGGYVNIGAQLEFYWNTTLFGDKNFNWFDSPVSSLAGFFREVEVDQFLRGGRKHTALRGELLFRDFTVGSAISPLSPIITGPNSVSMGGAGTFQISKRSCVPLDESLRYSVNWGDGTTPTTVEAAADAKATATHTFNAFGTRTINAKLVEDVAGRFIDEKTPRTITVNANAEPPIPTTVTVPATDADGNFTVTWTSTVNTTHYKVFRNTNNAGWVQLPNATGNSVALTAQPFGTNRYAVRSCNTMGCSDSRASGNILVGVVPTAPALTVTSLLCQGMNDVSWTATTGATSYKLYSSAGTNAANAGEIYSGSGRSQNLNVPSTTNLWVKACGTGGCSAFSAMKTANLHPGSCF